LRVFRDIPKDRLQNFNCYKEAGLDALTDRSRRPVRFANGLPEQIERRHQALKNRILLENDFLPGDLEAQIEAFFAPYNNQRYHESLNNVTPADDYFGRASAIVKQRERIKRQTIEYRRWQHRKLAAKH
jgi:transposase InsO family protein